jgi:hypothetical protein
MENRTPTRTHSTFLNTLKCLKHGFSPEAPFQSKACFRPSPSDSRFVNLAYSKRSTPPIFIGQPTVARPFGPSSIRSKNNFRQADQPPTTVSNTQLRRTMQVNHPIPSPGSSSP